MSARAAKTRASMKTGSTGSQARPLCRVLRLGAVRAWASPGCSPTRSRTSCGRARSFRSSRSLARRRCRSASSTPRPVCFRTRSVRSWTGRRRGSAPACPSLRPPPRRGGPQAEGVGPRTEIRRPNGSVIRAAGMTGEARAGARPFARSARFLTGRGSLPYTAASRSCRGRGGVAQLVRAEES